MSVAIVDYEWNESINAFRPKIDREVPLWNGIDLRPNAQITDGKCIVNCDDAALPADSIKIADEAAGDIWLSAQRRSEVGGALNINLDSSRLDFALFEIMTEHANTFDPNKWNEIVPTNENVYEIWLGEKIAEFPVVSGGSVITETFNTANSTTLGPNLSWTEYGTANLQIVSNHVEVTNLGVNGWGRADTDLESSNNYGQIVYTQNTNTQSTGCGAACRYSSSANTCYQYGRTVSGDTGTSNFAYLDKVVAGTRTSLGSVAFAWALNVSYTLRCNANGSSIWGYRDSTASHIAVTDSSITTGTRAGFFLTANTGISRSQADSFEAGDLGFFGYPKIIYLMRGA